MYLWYVSPLFLQAGDMYLWYVSPLFLQAGDMYLWYVSPLFLLPRAIRRLAVMMA